MMLSQTTEKDIIDNLPPKKGDKVNIGNIKILLHINAELRHPTYRYVD